MADSASALRELEETQARAQLPLRCSPLQPYARLALSRTAPHLPAQEELARTAASLKSECAAHLAVRAQLEALSASLGAEQQQWAGQRAALEADKVAAADRERALAAELVAARAKVGGAGQGAGPIRLAGGWQPADPGRGPFPALGLSLACMHAQPEQPRRHPHPPRCPSTRA